MSERIQKALNSDPTIFLSIFRNTYIHETLYGRFFICKLCKSHIIDLPSNPFTVGYLVGAAINHTCFSGYTKQDNPILYYQPPRGT